MQLQNFVPGSQVAILAKPVDKDKIEAVEIIADTPPASPPPSPNPPTARVQSSVKTVSRAQSRTSSYGKVQVNASSQSTSTNSTTDSQSESGVYGGTEGDESTEAYAALPFSVYQWQQTLAFNDISVLFMIGQMCNSKEVASVQVRQCMGDCMDSWTGSGICGGWYSH